LHWDSSKPGLPLFPDLIRERFEAALTGRTEIGEAPDDVERAIQEARYQQIERRLSIYALSDPSRFGGAGRFGILIYTATAGNQGTLGGLVVTARYFGRILHAALQRLELCSNDPICADHEPTSTADDRALHGAACHGCLLIAETSCEARNLFLDRALLVETMTGQQSAFFGQLG
jgi:hypothetical protein